MRPSFSIVSGRPLTSPLGGSTPKRNRYLAALACDTEAPMATPTVTLRPSLLWQGIPSFLAAVPRSTASTHSRENGVRSTMISRPEGT